MYAYMYSPVPVNVDAEYMNVEGETDAIGKHKTLAFITVCPTAEHLCSLVRTNCTSIQLVSVNNLLESLQAGFIYSGNVCLSQFVLQNYIP